MRTVGRFHDNRPAVTGRAGQRGGFTLMELLVVIGIVLILVSIFLPYVSRARESDRRVRCAENLRNIHFALSEYAQRNGQKVEGRPESRPLPRVRFDPQQPGYTAFTGADALDPFAPDATSATADAPTAANEVKANDVTASLWLLVREGLIEPYRFICPSSDDTPDPMYSNGRRVKPEQRSNFTGPHHLSYSYCSPFSTAPLFELNSDRLTADFATVADKNPGTSGGGDVAGPPFDAPPLDLARANSRNHGRAGQSVLYGDGHVQFKATPYCGVGDGRQRDNIYTAMSRTPLPAEPPPPREVRGFCGKDVGPAWKEDSYLVPTDDP